MELYCKAGEQPRPILYYKAGQQPLPIFPKAENAKRRKTNKNRHDHTEDGKPDVEVRKTADDKPAEVFMNVGSRQ